MAWFGIGGAKTSGSVTTVLEYIGPQILVRISYHRWNNYCLVSSNFLSFFVSPYRLNSLCCPSDYALLSLQLSTFPLRGEFI
jgi:hypothetical protein